MSSPPNSRKKMKHSIPTTLLILVPPLLLLSNHHHHHHQVTCTHLTRGHNSQQQQQQQLHHHSRASSNPHSQRQYLNASVPEAAITAAAIRLVSVAHRELPSSLVATALNLVATGPRWDAPPRLLQRLFDETAMGSGQMQAASSSRGPICIWNCAPKQNTTNLLLFTRPGTGEEPEARLTRFSSPVELKQSGFSAARPTVLLVHGFRGSGLSHQTWAVDLKDLILRRERANVLFADWSHHARVISYLHALEHIAVITEDLYSVFEGLESAHPRFKMADIHVVGHSLGAHIGGLLGQMMRGHLNQITALDPAGFLLTSAESNLKLSQDDAKYVSAFHTNAKYLGTEMLLADRDIFFNGGNDQPACRSLTSSLIPGACSHRQAVKYASVYMDKCIMVAYLCRDYETYLAGQCGFCAANSSACVAAGNEWQYNANHLASAALRPHKYDKKKLAGDRPWLEGQQSPARKYHLMTGPERPYCVFTYQVVVKFADDSPEQLADRIRALDLLLMHSNATGEGLWSHVSNRLRPDARLEVFGPGGREKTLSGRYLFTGLLVVERKHELYDEMPIKFREAKLVRSSLPASTTPGPTPATTSTSTSTSTSRPSASAAAQRELPQLEPPEVYVNFMSHPKFEARASSSGRLERVTFMQLPGRPDGGGGATRSKLKREPRIESAAVERRTGAGPSRSAKAKRRALRLLSRKSVALMRPPAVAQPEAD